MEPNKPMIPAKPVVRPVPPAIPRRPVSGIQPGMSAASMGGMAGMSSMSSMSGMGAGGMGVPGGVAASPLAPGVPRRPGSVPPPVAPIPPPSDDHAVPDDSDSGAAAPEETSPIVPLQWPTDNPYARPDSAELIVFDTDDEMTGLPRVKYATIDKLIERVTYAKYPDPNFLQAFMLTYRSFTTPKELLEKLKDRYTRPLPEGDPASVAHFAKTHQTPMRLRVYNILKTWVTNHWHDFEDDKQFLQLFLQFVRGDLKQTMEHAAEALDQLVQRALEGTEARKEFIFTQPPPRSILPYYRNPKSVKLLDLHPLEVARQLTLIEAELFRNIRPRECLNQAWNKHPDRAPNILAMIERFNSVSAWVMTAIVQGETKDQQTKIMQHFIDTADKCRSLNNYNASMAILAGLNDSSIFRLKKHWQALPPKCIEIFQSLQQLCASDQNYKLFRAHIKSVELPCIPYLGMYLTDLTFIEDGNPNTHGNLINFFKRHLVSEVIANIQQYQQTPYNLEPVKFLQFWLMNIRTLDKEKCYELSLQILPRGNKVEDLSSWNTPAAYRTATEAKKQADDLVKKQQAAAERRKREQELSVEANPIVEIGEYGEMEYIIGYRFGAEDSDKNIRFAAASARGGAPQVNAGTLEKLVERLTHEKFPDTQFIAQFMTTYRTFCTPKQLMEMLIMRYTLPRPKNRLMLEKFKQNKEMPIQLRVFNVFKLWVDKFHFDFLDCPPIQKLFFDFLKAKALGNSSVEKAASQLQTTLRQQIDSGPTMPVAQGRPPPSFPLNRGANPDSLRLLDFHHEEVARQLAMIEFEQYFQSRPHDLLNSIEKGIAGRKAVLANEAKRAAQIKAWMRDEFMSIGNDEAERLKLLNLFLAIAKSTFDMRCFSATHSIISALESPEIVGFNIDSVLPAASKPKLEEHKTTKRNLESIEFLREQLKTRQTDPCIPVFAGYVSEIVQIEQEEEDNISASMVNFEKRRKLSFGIRDLEQFRTTPYNFEPVLYLRKSITRENNEMEERVIDPDAARESFRQSLRDDGTFRTQVIYMLKQQLINEGELATLQQQIEESKAYMRQQLGALSACVASVAIPELESAMQQILEQQFPGGQHEQWKVLDSTGHVFGWQQEVSANIVHKDNQAFLCAVRPNLDKAEIAMLLRLKRLYEHYTSRTVDKVVVVTGYVSEVAQTIANHLGVAIFCCRPQ